MRERWFFAKESRRMGPYPLRQLVESLLALPEPRTCLIWRQGLPAWTPAEGVPEVERLLAPFAPAREVLERAEERSPVGSTTLSGTGEMRARLSTIPPGAAAAGKKSFVLVYSGIAGAVLLSGALAGLFWSRGGEKTVVTVGGGSSGGAPGGSPGGATGGAPGAATGGARPAVKTGFSGWGDQETDLPASELKRLRGVAGWSNEKLTVTLYNGSDWQVTEIVVRTSRLEKDQFVDSEAPHVLLPPSGAPVDSTVGQLLNKVARDRKKPGVNPLDTALFEVAAGTQPAAYRWKIEAARGYPPRVGS